MVHNTGKAGNEPLVSVVVPAYNAEKTIQNTVDDILSQTYHYYELIIIDDGSRDGTSEICDSFAARDSRIRVIHQTNKGLSCARNTGTREAAGQYITYIDSDDRIDKRYLEYLVRAVTETGADVACGRIDRLREGTEPGEGNEEYAVTLFDRKECIRQMLTGKEITVSACCRLVPTDRMIACPFQEGAYYEDLSNTYKVNLMSEKTAFINVPLYHYVMRGGSITGQKQITEKQCRDYYDAVNSCSEEIIARFPDLEKDAAVLKAKDYMSLYLNIHRCPEQNDELAAIEQDVIRWMGNIWMKAARNSMAPQNVRLRAMLFGISPRLYEKMYYLGIGIKGKKIR